MEPKINALIEKLNKLKCGPIPALNKTEVLMLLSDCWQYLEGSNNQNTFADKLYRAEKLSWDGSILSFTLERHGGTVNGSSRAALHNWVVDLANRHAEISKTGMRQLRPMDARMDTKKKAKEIAEQILSGEQNENFELREGGHIVLNIGNIIPETNHRTTTNRRKNFRDALEEIMAKKSYARKDVGSKMGFVLPEATISKDKKPGNKS